MKKLFLFLPIILLCSCERSRINQVNENACEDLYLIETFGDSMIAIVPNIFTPNQDQVNDDIQPSLFLNGRDLESYSWVIYYANEVVYTTFNPMDIWDGRSDSDNSPVGEYEYILEVKVEDVTYSFSGTFYLARPRAGAEVDIRYILQNCATCVIPDMINPREGAVMETNEM